MNSYLSLRALARREMKKVLFRIWTQVDHFVTDDDIHCIKHTFSLKECTKIKNSLKHLFFHLTKSVHKISIQILT